MPRRNQFTGSPVARRKRPSNAAGFAAGGVGPSDGDLAGHGKKPDVCGCEGGGDHRVAGCAVLRAGDGGKQDGEQTISYSATLPALAKWPVPGWAFWTDAELSATRELPTAVMACEWAGWDAAWEGSFGPVVNLRLSHEAVASEDSRWVMEIRGTKGAFVDWRFLLKRPAGGRAPTLIVPEEGDYRASTGIRVSPPLAKLLSRINPAFAELKEGDGLVTLGVTNLAVAAERAGELQAACRVDFPGMVLSPTESWGRCCGMEHSAAEGAGTMNVTAEAMRFRIPRGSNCV